MIAPMQSLSLIANPRAGQGRGRDAAEEAERAFLAAGWKLIERAETQFGGHAVELAERLAPLSDVLVAVGGDGTLAEVLRGVGDHDCSIGQIPMGTANVVARELGLPLGPPQRVAQLLASASKARVVDIGRCGERPLLAMLGAGYDSQVCAAVEASRRRRGRGGMLGFLIPSLKQFLSYPMASAQIELAVDSESKPGRYASVIVSNTRNYGGFMSFAPEASMSSGQFEVTALKSRGHLGLLLSHTYALLRRRQPRWLADSFSGREIEIRSDRSLPVQIDGDDAEELALKPGLPLHLRLSPQAARLLAPDHAHGDACDD